MKLWLALLFLFKCSSADPIPIVLWHGMGDTCCMPYSLGFFKIFLERQIPGVYVLSLKLGNSTVEDFENGYFMYPNKQVEIVCKELATDPKLTNGFNAIGFSQGSQFFWVQKALVQATYWHDPLDDLKYKQNSEFLGDINNERNINNTYIDNLNKLEHFVMVKFENDSIVQPRDTEWFGFYAPGQATEVISLQQSDLYTQDRLGLKKMDEAGKLVFLSQPGDHLRFSQDWFIKNIIKPYLL